MESHVNHKMSQVIYAYALELLSITEYLFHYFWISGILPWILDSFVLGEIKGRKWQNLSDILCLQNWSGSGLLGGNKWNDYHFFNVDNADSDGVKKIIFK